MYEIIREIQEVEVISERIDITREVRERKREVKRKIKSKPSEITRI